MTSSDSLIDVGALKELSWQDVNINTGAQSINTERASLLGAGFLFINGSV